MLNLILFSVSLFLVIKSADFAIKYAVNLARVFRIPKYVIGFIVVSLISILPETFISINSAISGMPSFGLGTLFGSNVADLTIVFAIIIFSTKNGVRVGSKILENNKLYPFILTLPILVGLDGFYSKIEGIFLIISGVLFFLWTLKRNKKDNTLPVEEYQNNKLKNIINLLFSMSVLLFGSFFTVKYGVNLANLIGVSPFLMGVFVVGLGTVLPELIFSLKAVKNNGGSMALGDILGTVISDATIAVGIIALINPFYFPKEIIYVTAMFMVLASLVLFSFMRSGKILTKKEGFFLLLFYLFFILIEYIMGV